MITLPKPWLGHDALPAARPNNVFVTRYDGAITLINAGHPHQLSSLQSALDELGLHAAAVDRIIATSWAPDTLGGAVNFPLASVFVASPDRLAPTRYEDYLEGERELIRRWADEIKAQDGWEWLDTSGVEAFIEAWLPPTTNALPVVPMSSGHIVCAGELRLEVHDAPGPDPGHVLLYEPRRGWLFSGDLSRDGLPAVVTSMQGTLLGMERAVELAPQILLPSYGLIDEDAQFSLRRTLRFLNNLMSSAPAAMHGGGRTLLNFIKQDLGFKPTRTTRLIYTARAYMAALEELVYSKTIDASGTGLSRRYGIDVEDPREELRR